MGRIVRIIIAGFMLVGLASGSSVWAQSLDELHKAAAKEGALNFYATLAQINAEIVLPTFEKRFPGIKINHVDATSDKLVARAVSEARGGKTLADVLQVPRAQRARSTRGMEWIAETHEPLG